jgi:hypothetical protein
MDFFRDDIPPTRHPGTLHGKAGGDKLYQGLKLTSLGGQTPTGKYIAIEVGGTL